MKFIRRCLSRDRPNSDLRCNVEHRLYPNLLFWTQSSCSLNCDILIKGKIAYIFCIIFCIRSFVMSIWKCTTVCNRNDPTQVKSTCRLLHLLREIARLSVAYCCYSSTFKEIGQSLKIGAPQFLPIYKTKWHCNSILNLLMHPLWLQ